MQNTYKIGVEILGDGKQRKQRRRFCGSATGDGFSVFAFYVLCYAFSVQCSVFSYKNVLKKKVVNTVGKNRSTMTEKKLTADEISLYDRQIRLWGMEAQTNLRNSKILLINLTGVGVEIVKNLVLGGVGSLTLMDCSKVSEQELNSNFFIDKSQVGMLKVDASKDRIEDMNPRVQFQTDSRNWEDLKESEFSQFQLIVCTGFNSEQLSKLNKISRNLNIPLIACSVHGMYGFIFNDLIKCESWIKQERLDSRKVGDINDVSKILALEDITENDIKLQKVLVENSYRSWDELSGKYLHKQYPTERRQKRRIIGALISLLALLELPEVYLHKDIEDVIIKEDEMKNYIRKVLNKLELPDSIQMEDMDLKKFIRNAYCEYQPTNAIIGGVVSQDIINTLVHKELPINNVSVLDGFNSEMPIYIL